MAMLPSTAKDSSTSPMGIAIVGAGLMGTQHAHACVTSPNVALIGITSYDQQQAQQLAAVHGVTCFPDLASILNDDRVEAVIIATPTDTHHLVALTAIESGRHVFIEKPVARTLEAAETIQQAAQQAAVVVGVGHVIRYFPEYRSIGAAIARGDIGTPAVATFGRRCQQPDWAPDAWHTSMIRSGGVAVDMLVHDVDLVRWYFGEPTHVYARVIGSDKHNGIDYALATLTIPAGPICHLHGSWAEPTGFSQTAEVCGSAGMISYDSRGRDSLQFATHGESAAVTALPPPPAGPSDPFQLQLRDFVHAIRTGAELPGDMPWALGSLRIALAMLESSDQREVIELSTESQVPA